MATLEQRLTAAQYAKRLRKRARRAVWSGGRAKPLPMMPRFLQALSLDLGATPATDRARERRLAEKRRR